MTLTTEQIACPNFEDHTPQPEGYIAWHSWAEGMSKTHEQRKCSGCDRYEIWEPKANHLEQNNDRP